MRILLVFLLVISFSASAGSLEGNEGRIAGSFDPFVCWGSSAEERASIAHTLQAMPKSFSNVGSWPFSEHDFTHPIKVRFEVDRTSGVVNHQVLGATREILKRAVTGVIRRLNPSEIRVDEGVLVVFYINPLLNEYTSPKVVIDAASEHSTRD